MKGWFGLFIFLSFILPDIEGQDIDSPLSLAEIEKYESRVRLQRLPDVVITYPDAYKIETQQPVYSPQTKEIILNVINIDAPTAEPEYFWLKQWEKGKWVNFPFIDNLIFAGVGRDLAKGDTLPEPIRMSIFKNRLKPNRYQVHFYVFANIYTYGILTVDSMLPVKESELKGAFDFRIVASGSDSIRILFENHTNLSVQPVFLSSVGTDELYTVHPLARSGWVGEADYMKSCALLAGGEAMLFTIPVAWESSRISDPNRKERYKSGRLAPGKYKIGLQVEVYMDTEFEVK